MSIIAWIIVGLSAGFIASKIVEHRGSGLLLDMVLGVAGATLGGLLFQMVGSTGVTGLNLWSVVVSTLGAVILLVFWNAITRRRLA
jgi:uncharacterized membrane protein YeaQ/YmgE (transglycosylase-associated protein family)